MPDSENDSLFDYDVDENDLRGLADTSHDAADSNSRGKGSGNAATQKDDLGLDENLVVRTRKPTVKLDHHM